MLFSCHLFSRLFMTHFGGVGTMEAIWTAVPMVGMALEGDQMTIQHRVVNRGIGRALDSAGDHADAIFEVIIDVLENPRYRDNIKRMSRYQRLSENPLDKAVRLVEFVRQTGGAPHLKHHGRQVHVQSDPSDGSRAVVAISLMCVYI